MNAARSILILEGANPETHDGAVTLLSLRFVKTGVLPVDVIKKFKVLLSRRADVDDGDFDTTGVAEAEDSLRNSEKIVEMIDGARGKIIADFENPS